MSQSADPGNEAEQSPSEEPDIEEDLFDEELRIDGICGVY
jgi:mycofactocin precursor